MTQPRNPLIGRPPLPYEVKLYNLTLEPTDAEWAKAQPGGMSEMVRDLIAWERWLREGEYASLADLKSLAVDGFRRELTREEQQRLCGAVLSYAGEVCSNVGEE